MPSRWPGPGRGSGGSRCPSRSGRSCCPPSVDAARCVVRATRVMRCAPLLYRNRVGQVDEAGAAGSASGRPVDEGVAPRRGRSGRVGGRTTRPWNPPGRRSPRRPLERPPAVPACASGGRLRCSRASAHAGVPPSVWCSCCGRHRVSWSGSRSLRPFGPRAQRRGFRRENEGQVHAPGGALVGSRAGAPLAPGCYGPGQDVARRRVRPCFSRSRSMCPGAWCVQGGQLHPSRHLRSVVEPCCLAAPVVVG